MSSFLAQTISSAWVYIITLETLKHYSLVMSQLVFNTGSFSLIEVEKYFPDQLKLTWLSHLFLAYSNLKTDVMQKQSPVWSQTRKSACTCALHGSLTTSHSSIQLLFSIQVFVFPFLVLVRWAICSGVWNCSKKVLLFVITLFLLEASTFFWWHSYSIYLTIYRCHQTAACPFSLSPCYLL